MDEYSKYIKENTMTESEYKKWFYKYLGDVETGFEANLDSPILNAPKLFNFWKWFFWLCGSTIFALCGSAIFYFIPQIKNEWLCNFFLSIGTGIIASIILLVFTQSREKNITYLNDIIPLLEKRHKDMSEAIYYDMARESIAAQNGFYQIYFDCYHRFINTYAVITNFYKLLCETAKYKPKYLTMYLSHLDENWELKKKYEEMYIKIIIIRIPKIIYLNYYVRNLDLILF